MKRNIVLIVLIYFINYLPAQTISYSYDSLGRLKKVIYPDSSTIKYTYDALGNRITKVTTPSPFINWTGLTSKDWATSTNWSTNTVPISTDNVLIPVTVNQPIISKNSSAITNKLTINYGAVVTDSGSLQIDGIINNSGNIEASSGSIILSGLLPQTISASFFINNLIRDLTINNSSGVTLSGTVTVTGTLNPTLGVLNSGGYLTIAPSGSVAAGSGSIIGNVTVQENMTNQRGWRIIGSPFTTPVSLANLASASNIDITYGGTNIYGGVSAASSEIYIPATNSWSTLSSGSSWAANSSMALFIRGTAGQGINGSAAYPGWISGPDYGGSTPSPVTLTAAGTLNTSNISYGISAGNFNMVPNPFAATISVQSVIGNSTPFFYYNPASGAHNAATKGGAYIPVIAGTDAAIPKYGCFVFTPSSGSLLNIPTSAIHIGGTPVSVFGNDSVRKFIELVVQSNAVYYDKLFVELEPNSSSASGDHYDLLKFNNDGLNVYTKSTDTKNLAIDARNVLNSIPLGITAATGNYDLKLNTNTLPETITVYLKDNLLNTQTELSTGDLYHFSISSDTASYGEHRFELVFNTKQSVNVAPDQSGTLSARILGNITNNSRVGLEITGAAGPIKVRINDMSGKLLSELNTVNGIQYISVGNAASGMLIIQISDGKNSITQKLIKL